MPGARDNRFTIYDALEKSGYFDANPANTYARDLATGANLFRGPVEFPKMLYHPEGERRVTVAGEEIVTPLGAKLVGQQTELIWAIAENEEQERAMLAEGWKDHPAKSIRVRIEKLIAAGQLTADALKTIPQISSDHRIRELELEIARLNAFHATEQQIRSEDVGRSGADALADRKSKSAAVSDL